MISRDTLDLQEVKWHKDTLRMENDASSYTSERQNFRNGEIQGCDLLLSSKYSSIEDIYNDIAKYEAEDTDMSHGIAKILSSGAEGTFGYDPNNNQHRQIDRDRVNARIEELSQAITDEDNEDINLDKGELYMLQHIVSPDGPLEEDGETINMHELLSLNNETAISQIAKVPEKSSINLSNAERHYGAKITLYAVLDGTVFEKQELQDLGDALDDLSEGDDFDLLPA